MKKPKSGLALGLTVCSLLAAFHAGCTVSSHRARSNQPMTGAVAQPASANIGPTESYGAVQPQQFGRLPLFLPGSQSQQLVNFQVVGGNAVFEGDIVLGPVASLPMRYGIPKVANPSVKSAVAVSNDSYLWPDGVIPYVIDGTVPQEKREYIAWAVARINETELTMRPRAGAENDYVNFNGAGSGCTSYVGRIRGSQELQVAECGQGSVIHEILHAAGFYHEQSRADRDNYVTIVFDEIVPSYRSAFEKRGSQSQDIGGYDYGSIMHYSRTAFSRSGKPTIVPKDPNAQIGQRDGLSPLDRAAITQLYGGSSAPPPTVPPAPPTTQPPGSQPPGPGTQPPPASGSFAGSYTSNRGDVTCSQNAVTVNCQYPGGTMMCAVRGDNNLDCGWSGGGQGRAAFVRQPNGVLSGTWGDFLSNSSRGQWDLVPAGSGPGTGTPPGPGTGAPPGPGTGAPPGPGTGAPPGPGTGSPASLTGSYASTRGPMTCTESGSSWTCTFQEGSAAGRLSCVKDSGGLNLSCNWATLFPTPGMGQAAFSRKSTSDRNLSGTWGRFGSSTDGGTWEVHGQ